MDVLEIYLCRLGNLCFFSKRIADEDDEGNGVSKRRRISNSESIPMMLKAESDITVVNHASDKKSLSKVTRKVG